MIKNSIIAAVFFWHNFLGVALAYIFGQSSVCRFEPSCSVYLAKSVKKFGLILGFKLGFSRLLKCQPFSKAGFKNEHF